MRSERKGRVGLWVGKFGANEIMPRKVQREKERVAAGADRAGRAGSMTGRPNKGFRDLGLRPWGLSGLSGGG